MVHVGRGKVRELYALDDQRLLVVATDRISTFDVVLPTEIPDKGKVLTGLSAFWFARTRTLCPNHLIAVLPDGRSTECRRLTMLPIECVVRGHLSGSGWRDYRETGEVCGHRLPAGLRESEHLPEPIFTPATKATTGHDENITEAETRNLLGDDLYEELRKRSVDIYLRAADHAAANGVILADTKFEFGFAGDELLLIDEVLTPDSSRYWPADEWTPGQDVPSFDKQYVREWLDTTDWDKTAPAPDLPGDIVSGTRSRYIEAYERITGEPFADYLDRS